MARGMSKDGKEYQIGSAKGNDFVNNAKAGSTMVGGDGSTWTKNSDGSTTISKNGTTYTVGGTSGSSGGGSSGGGSLRPSGSSGGRTISSVGYSPNGGTYEIGSERGQGFLDNAKAGSTLNGSDGSVWRKNEDGTTTIEKNGVTYTVGTPKQPQQPQQPQQVNDLSEYLRDLYRAQMQADLSALEGAYNANVTRMQRQGELVPQKYDAMRNLAAAQNEVSRRNFAEYAAARGLNTGTSGQAELARSAELQKSLADLGAQEAQASGTLESELTALEQQYNAAVSQAQASGNADLAKALYQELVRQQSAAAAQAEADAEQERWLTEFEASRKDAADALALAYAKLAQSSAKSGGKSDTGDSESDIGGSYDSGTGSGNVLLGTNGLPSYSDVRRTITSYMAQGNAAAAQSFLRKYWDNMSAAQQNELSSLFGG